MIHLKKIVKTYWLANENFYALKGVSFRVEKGEFVAIMGHSGSGKSTLMNIIGMLDIPTSGEYVFDGQTVENLSDNEQAEIRGRRIGFVFQSYNLLPRMSALAQVGVPLMYQGVHKRERNKRSEEALEIVGLADKKSNLPNELSGGQQQRVSIARAIVTNPGIILADEPTGALDSKTGNDIMNIFTDLNKAGKTIVVITHEQNIANYAKRTIRISDGEIFESP